MKIWEPKTPGKLWATPGLLYGKIKAGVPEMVLLSTGYKL